MLGIDDEDLVELVGQLLGLAQVVDGLADGPEGRDRDQLPLHEAAGTVLRVGEDRLENGAIARRNRLQDLALLLLLQILDQVDGIVGVELGDGRRQVDGAELLDHLVADLFLEFGENLRIEIRPHDVDQLPPLVGAHPLQ